MQDILVDPRTEEIVEVISQERWERKWAEIISMHCSPHDVWTVHHNWKYITMLPDKRVVPGAYPKEFPGSTVYRLQKGLYSFTNIHGKNIILELDGEGRRLIRNHRAYWKSYLVPDFFTEDQWEHLCAYHKEEYRQLFCKGKTFPIDQRHDHTLGAPSEVVEQKIRELYVKFRGDLKDVIGKDYYNQTYRMDCWNWGTGDCSDFVPLRVNFKVRKRDKISLDVLSETTRVTALDKNSMIRPKYHKIVTRQEVTA